jgi:hypothetical protein
MDSCGKSRPPPGFDPRTVQPVASRYTDRATPAPGKRYPIIIIIIIIITIIGKDTISFMQGIYIYIPEKNSAPKEYNVAAIL